MQSTRRQGRQATSSGFTPNAIDEQRQNEYIMVLKSELG